MRTILSFMHRPMTRGKYLSLGVALLAVKLPLDHFLARFLFAKSWSPLNYLLPGTSLQATWDTADDHRFFLTMLGAALPFILLGIWATARRLQDAGLSRLLTALFFVPLVNLLTFAVLCIVPSWIPQTQRAANEELPPDLAKNAAVLSYGVEKSGPLWSLFDRILPQDDKLNALVSALLAATLAPLFVLLGIFWFETYGWGLFVGLPFVLGLVSTILYGWRRPRRVRACVWIGLLSALFAAIFVMLLALEGAICLIMLIPLALPIVMTGSIVGYMIQIRPQRDGVLQRTLWIIPLLLPLLMGAEASLQPKPTLIAVTTTIEIDAPPGVVWNNVISFGSLPEPTDWFFKTGLAYPKSARIVGRDVGAIRYCEFSTGPFVEPITVWDEPRRLAFSVNESPPPMEELSFFKIDPPHLHHFFDSEQGEFRLTELPSGKTQLAGTTWYRHKLWPETYWVWWSDQVIHRIHHRVLEHVKHLSEIDAGNALPQIK